MKRIVKKLLVVGIVITTCMLASNDTFAGGPPGPPSGGGDPPCWPAPCVPIDGGISFLIAAGLAYGGKKAYGSIKGKR